MPKKKTASKKPVSTSRAGAFVRGQMKKFKKAPVKAPVKASRHQESRR